ncbi:conserved hypothetical protein [Luminiphilus syltensis NOR5-1B]|uniref:Uncharacterized protein n=2 Tax=Luminiphilus TaxID=1341118 RepID=B8KYM3_9GAMM|nr:conserved hypothetical protein [Luminiphilus syltensis NOR5-1B]
MRDQASNRVPFDMPDWLAQQTRQHQAQAPYLGLGFAQGQLPDELHNVLRDKLAASAGQFRPEQAIPELATADADFIPAMHFEDPSFNAAICDTLRPAHEAWSGMELIDSACYGFRAYQRGSYLHNHVDRGTTHIISSTICVDSRLDEPWPLYIEDIYGEAHEVNLSPGEFIYYEGARLIHGRPWPLVGDYYVGLFVHYRPVGT